MKGKVGSEEGGREPCTMEKKIFLCSEMKRGCECFEKIRTQYPVKGKQVTSEYYFSLLISLGTCLKNKCIHVGDVIEQP